MGDFLHHAIRKCGTKFPRWRLAQVTGISSSVVGVASVNAATKPVVQSNDRLRFPRFAALFQQTKPCPHRNSFVIANHSTMVGL